MEFLKGDRRVLFGSDGFLDSVADLPMEFVHTRVRVGPLILEVGLIERPQKRERRSRPGRDRSQQGGTRRDQETDRELHGIRRVDQVNFQYLGIPTFGPKSDSKTGKRSWRK